MVQPPFSVDNSPPCIIQVQPIVTSSGLNRWRSAGPMREVRRMARMSFWLASSRWRGWQWPAEHPQQPRVCHIGHGSIPSKENDPYRSPRLAAPVFVDLPQSIFKHPAHSKHRNQVHRARGPSACCARLARAPPPWRLARERHRRRRAVRRLTQASCRRASKRGPLGRRTHSCRRPRRADRGATARCAPGKQGSG